MVQYTLAALVLLSLSVSLPSRTARSDPPLFPFLVHLAHLEVARGRTSRCGVLGPRRSCLFLLRLVRLSHRTTHAANSQHREIVASRKSSRGNCTGSRSQKQYKKNSSLLTSLRGAG